jgi:ribonuclease VapC
VGSVAVFVETSAIVSMVAREPGYKALATQIETATLALTSPVVILEASMVLASRLGVEPDQAESRVRTVLEQGGVAIAAIDDATAKLAIEAFARFGKGRGHPARLNMADCLSYACAKQHRVPLLYIGNDFAQTDLA